MAGVEAGAGHQGQAVAPAWYPDPYGGASHRWFDGTAWTDDVGPAEPQYGLQPMRNALDRNLFLDQKALISGNDFLRTPQGEQFGVMQKRLIGDVTVHSAEGSWVFDLQGLTQNRLEIRVLPANAPIASFEWYGGVQTGREGILRFPDQRWFRFVATGAVENRVARGENFRRTDVPMVGAWSFFPPEGNTGLVTSRLAWPEGGRLLFPGDITVDIPVTVRTSANNNTSAEVLTDVFETLEGRRETPLLVLLSTFLVWWYAIVRDRAALSANHHGGGAGVGHH